MSENVIDILEDAIAHYGVKLLDALLQDKTTKKNIIWGTSDYRDLGIDYEAANEIKSSLIKPIYQHFVQAAKKIKPDYASFVIPTRWYAGGKGLDEFRDEMINDEHIEILHDFLAPEKVFPNTNIRGGICYFLWDKKYNNISQQVRVVTHDNVGVISDIMRPLKIEDIDIFITHTSQPDIVSDRWF